MSGKRIVKEYYLDFPVSRKQITVELKTFTNKIFEGKPSIRQIMICSVVPEVTARVEKICRQKCDGPICVIGRDMIVPIKNNYRNPKQVGQDRLVGAYAAKILYGAPLVIVDFGTAITFDVVSGKGHYEGGIIVPGLRLSLESLFKKTALLPNIENIIPPKDLIGRDTKSSMLSGIFNGYGHMCAGLIQSIAKKVKGRPKIIMTGGHTHFMKRYIRQKIDKIDGGLVFKGLALLAAKSQK